MSCVYLSAKKYQQLFPSKKEKSSKKKEEKPPAEKKEKPKAKPQEEEEPEPAVQAPKFKDPYAGLPPRLERRKRLWGGGGCSYNLIVLSFFHSVRSSWTASNVSTQMKTPQLKPYLISGRTLTRKGGAYGRQSIVTTRS